jgi:hypothetical protein
MREHRGTIGGTLLAAAGGCWIAAPTVIASHQAHWSDGPILGLLTAGGLCLLLGFGVLSWPILHRADEQTRALAYEFAASFLEEEGIRPSYWQRIRHPRTSVRNLPLYVPRSIQEKYRARQDALQDFLDELENNARDLGRQVNDAEIYLSPRFPGSAWERHRHLFNSQDLVWTREIVQDAYLRTHALNQKHQARYDAASVSEMNDPEWRKLTEEEIQDRQAALAAVVAARSAVKQARDGRNPGEGI